MPLLKAHLILIGAALTLAIGFGLRALVGFSRRGASIDLALGLASLVVAVGLALYFRTVRARWEASKARRDPPR
jgi:hypothetical protein